jgi:hypothetical protein
VGIDLERAERLRAAWTQTRQARIAKGESAASKSPARLSETVRQTGGYLIARFWRENDIAAAGLENIDPAGFANYVLSLKPSVSSSLFRLYRTAAIERIAATPHANAHSALLMLEADIGDGGLIGTSSRRKDVHAVEISREVFDDVMQLAALSRSQASGWLRLWLRAGITTGLRPVEWSATEVEEGASTKWLHVLGRWSIAGASRTLNITGLGDGSYGAIKKLSQLGAEWTLKGKFYAHQSQVNRLMQKLAYRDGARPITLESLRMQFIANMRHENKTTTEMSALLGTMVTSASSAQFGKRRTDWAEVVDVPSALPAEIALMRERISYFEKRLAFDRLMNRGRQVRKR